MDKWNDFKLYLWNKWRERSLRSLQKQIEDLSFKIQLHQFENSKGSKIFKDSEKALRQMELLNQDIDEYLKKEDDA